MPFISRKVRVMSETLHAVLEEMNAEVGAGPEVYWPSRFWERLNALHDAQLNDSGLRSFKRTVNQSYYNWVLGLRDPQTRSLVSWWLTHPTPSVVGARIVDWQGFESQSRRNPLESRPRRWLYQMAVATLWERARAIDRLHLLDRLEEPSLGSPVAVHHRGRNISQDLGNSVLELYSISEALGTDRPGGKGVVELGAGYGRLAWLYLMAFPGIRYVVVDIPPALALSQWYLTTLLPDRKFFPFRRFASYADVSTEFDMAEVAFLTPNQLDLIPPQDAALFVNVSSLHEMRPDQIQRYVALVDRHTSGVFYSKQWRTWTNPDDGLSLSQADYPILASWQTIYSRQHPVQTAFFEAAYRIGSHSLSHDSAPLLGSAASSEVALIQRTKR